MTTHERHELLECLEALCEERLTERQRDRLERAVLDDAQARRLYLDYIDLHGTLYWDAAGAARSELPEPRVNGKALQAAASAPPARTQRQRTLLVASSAAVVLLAASVAFWGPRLFGPSPDQGHGPLGGTGPGDVRPVPSVGTGDPIHLPPLDGNRPRDGGTFARNNADNGAPGTQVTPANAAASALGIVSFIDDEIAEAWRDAEIVPSATADDSEWLRRASLDIVGRIPSSEEAAAFLADTRPDKRRQLIDDLLAHPDAARHFATVWTNLLVGRSPAPEINRAGLHQFLAQQFHVNRPWTDTVAQLVAAEGSGRDNGAANFLLAHLNNEAVPATAVTARSFLGMQVQCTQCHKHPYYQQWGQDQFWELNSFFQQTEVVRHTRVNPQTGATEFDYLELVNKPVGGATFYETRAGEMKAAYPRFADQDVAGGPETNRRRELARLLTSGDQPQLAKAFVNRTWAHFFGYGFTSPVDDMGPHNRPTHPELLDRLADEFVKSGYDTKHLIRWICNARAYQLTSRFSDGNVIDDPAAGDPPYFSRMYVKPLTAEQLFDSVLVASRADQADPYFTAEADRRRQRWLRDFYSLEQTEENCEATTFDGSLPQALAMMNGPLVQQAVSGAPGTLLGEVLTAPASETEKIRRLSLAVLSRYPTPRELEELRNIMSQIVRARGQSEQAVSAATLRNDALRDVYWGYLNSGEFVSNY